MRVKQIELDFFRNYVHFEAVFDRKINVIYGENAQGKTNLLEAISYLSSAQSHRTRFDRELIQRDIDHGFIKAEIESRDRDFTLEARLSRLGRRQLFSNGVKLKTAGELSGILGTVLFTPEDLGLVRDGAAARRRFLNDCICQLRPRYAEALAEYRRLYDHKVRILRDCSENPSLLDTLDDFNLRLAQTGAVIIHYRAHFLRKLRETAPAIHLDFSGGREELGLQYETVSTVTDPLAAPKLILPQLLQHQEEHRRAEIESRLCLSGPHKDDFAVLLNGFSAKTYASQGQTRTAALSLKLASREIFHEDTGSWPVLLLDDVLSELDAHRQSFVLERIHDGQIFITCCEKADFGPEAKVFHIDKGGLR